MAFTGDEGVGETLAAQEPAKAAEGRVLLMIFSYRDFLYDVLAPYYIPSDVHILT